MYYIDSQRTLTRRESSLILPKNLKNVDNEYETLSTRGQSAARLISESGVTVGQRPRGAVRKEIITSLFESMLNNIVESWDVIGQRKIEELNSEVSKSPSEMINTVKKKKSAVVKQSKTKRSRSKVELIDSTQSDVLQLCWWAAPNERALIRFRNGNTYEGNISMKCMHGEGRYQWADGTVFFGQFEDNEIIGRGTIQWKDDTWYEGEFSGNLRHGKGLFVDSRKQCSYFGGWHYGTKHGEGIIYYSKCFENSYKGEWVHNIRHGFGAREYCKNSGYKGEWDGFIREGKGLMIWPNHDFYRGEWKNGLMSGYGTYIWDAYYNSSMSTPSLCSYHGFWEKGKRHGYGVLELGLGLGSFYKGEFKNNKKHGNGRFVTNNGLILQHKNLFIDDNIGHLPPELKKNEIPDSKYIQLEEPYKFDICDSSVGLTYHIEQVIKNIDKQKEIRRAIINDFIDTNKIPNLMTNVPKLESEVYLSKFDFEDLMEFEVSSLNKALRCYESELKYIYYQYANICNSVEVNFTPVLIRLYLWQLYFDCNINNKGLTLVEIDTAFHENPDWLSSKPHNPFEKIHFWQFRHHLITVSRKLYGKRQLPDKKPDSMLGDAFRMFMEKDILPGAGRKRGKLAEGYGSFVPLKALYELYSNLGEPCTIRDFLCATRQSPHYYYKPQPSFVEGVPIIGNNVFVIGDEMDYIIDEPIKINDRIKKQELKLFNLCNLSSRTIIKIFSLIFPQISETDKILSLDISITFFEFFEAFIKCVEESIRINNEERKRFSLNNINAEAQTLPTVK